MAHVVLDKLREEVEARALTYREAAKRTGVTHGTLQKFVTNKRYTPAFDTIVKLARAFQYDLKLVDKVKQ